MSHIKKIYLHAGADKTGSTALQYAFHLNRDLIRKSSYFYAAGRYHPYLAAHFSDFPSQLDYFRIRPHISLNEINERAEQWINDLISDVQTSNCDYLILSYEGFTGLSLTEWRRLYKFLIYLCPIIEVIYYVREPFSYAASAMSQRVKFGFPAWDIHPPVTQHKPRLEVLTEVFGKEAINLRLFSRESLENGDIIEDFFLQIGLERSLPPKLKTEGRELNISLCEEAILIGDAIIYMLPDSIKSGVQFNKIFAPVLKQINGRPYQFSDLQKQVIDLATREDRAFLSKEFGIELEIRFDKNSIDTPALTHETASSLAEIIMASNLPSLNIQRKAIGYQPEQVIPRALGKVQALQRQTLKFEVGKVVTLEVTIINNSAYWWGGRVAPVNISYHWYDKHRQLIIFDGERTALPLEGISSGEHVNLRVVVVPPQQRGEYFLQLTLVQEYFSWLENIGLATELLSVSVGE